MNRSQGLFHIAVTVLLLGLAGPAGSQPAGGTSDAPAAPDAPRQVVYGADNRLDYGDAAVTPAQRRAADATALVVSGAVTLLAGHLGRKTSFSMPSRTRFCAPQTMAELRRKGQLPPNYPDEAFAGDRALAQSTCTAFKVGPDLVATAGHCAGSQSVATACYNLNFIFNYHKSASKPAPDKRISGTDVYQCREIVARDQTGGLDWAVVRVDRVIDAPQVRLRSASMPPLGLREGLTLIGHPAGLPLKVAAGGRVLNLEEHNFRATLDAYGGNSGSPIFNSDRLQAGELLVEGLLQGGASDFVDWCNNPSRVRLAPTPRNTCACAVSYRCAFSVAADSACEGEIGVYARILDEALHAEPGAVRKPDPVLRRPDPR